MLCVYMCMTVCGDQRAILEALTQAPPTFFFFFLIMLLLFLNLPSRVSCLDQGAAGSCMSPPSPCWNYKQCTTSSFLNVSSGGLALILMLARQVLRCLQRCLLSPQICNFYKVTSTWIMVPVVSSFLCGHSLWLNPVSRSCVFLLWDSLLYWSAGTLGSQTIYEGTFYQKHECDEGRGKGNSTGMLNLWLQNESNTEEMSLSLGLQHQIQASSE